MQTSSVESDGILHQSLEWRGELSRATTNSAYFALLLALHESRAEGVRFNEDSEGKPDATVAMLKSLNSYPPVPLEATEKHIAYIKQQSLLRSQGDFTQAWFEQCAHPNPLHCKNNNTIEDTVIDNCAWGTQRYLRQGLTESSSATVSPDATLLADILPSVQAML